MGLPEVPNRSEKGGLNKYIRRDFKRSEKRNIKGLLKNPVFYFSLIAIVLFGGMFSSSSSLANISGFNNSDKALFSSFFNQGEDYEKENLFSNQNSIVVLESPDFKVIQENTLAGVSTPTIVTGNVLGSVLGSLNNQTQNKKEIINYTVQAGDTLSSIANAHRISAETILSVNELKDASMIRVGQNLVILPTEGILHVVKDGDTVSKISQTYKSKQEEIIAINDLKNQSDIYIGDILIVPGGVVPKKVASASSNTTSPSASSQKPVASSYFIFPAEGEISQRLHYYNAIDIANKCGTPVYASAGGTIQKTGYDKTAGNYVRILHENGVITFYGHLSRIAVSLGQKVSQGTQLGNIGNTGYTIGPTGCHLHFEVRGATNFLSKYALGAKIRY